MSITWKKVRHLIAGRIYGKMNSLKFYKQNVKHGKFYINGIIDVHNIGTIIIGNNFKANSGKNKNIIGGDTLLRFVVYKKNAILKIGDNVGISNSAIICWDKIEIGDNVMIGGSCKIWDTNFHSLDPVIRNGEEDNDVRTAAIYISKNVFVGANVMILKGVTIGENSIIAAGSVVNKNIPPNVIAGGNPCSVIRKIVI